MECIVENQKSEEAPAVEPEEEETDPSLVICTTLLTPRTKEQAASITDQLGAIITDNWEDSITHLVCGTVTLRRDVC